MEPININFFKLEDNYFTTVCWFLLNNNVNQLCACVLSYFSHVRLFVIPWTVVHEAPLSMGFSRQKKLEWVAIPFSRGSSPSRDQTHVSYVSVSCIGRRAPYHKHHMESPESAIHISIYVYTIYLYRWIPSFLSFPLLSPFPAHLTPLGHPRAPS